jgi:hypothetical protein
MRSLEEFFPERNTRALADLALTSATSAELLAIVRCTASRAFRIFPVFQSDDGDSIMATLMAIILSATRKEIDREGNIRSFGELPLCEEAE